MDVLRVLILRDGQGKQSLGKVACALRHLISRSDHFWLRRCSLIFCVIGILAHPGQTLAFEIPARPLQGYVLDVPGVLSIAEKQSINEIIQQYRRTTSNEIGILIVPSLQGEDIADIAVTTGRQWGVGTKEFSNGIMIVLSIEDREVFLATGYGLEGAIPDIVAKGIIDMDIVPALQQGSYAQALKSGIRALQKHIGGEYTASRYPSSQDSDGWEVFAFFGYLIFQWFLVIMARTKSWWLGGVIGAGVGLLMYFFTSFLLGIPLMILLGLILDYVVSKNFHRPGRTSWWAGGSWGPGGGGGGGFGGFSGGSFGGGGARGKW